MALFAFPGCSLVDHSLMSIILLALVVAHPARNTLVSAVEFEGRVEAVVEFGGPPAQNRVAHGASLFVSASLELAAVHVGMAAGAILGGAVEGDAAHIL